MAYFTHTESEVTSLRVELAGERERADKAEAERNAHATARNLAAEEYRKLEAERDKIQAKHDAFAFRASNELAAERERADKAEADLAEARKQHGDLIERLCALIPDDEGDDVAVEALIVEWVTRQRTQRDQAEALIREFVAARDEYIVAIKNCPADNADDYHRWQGHAAARRQLGERLAKMRAGTEDARA